MQASKSPHDTKHQLQLANPNVKGATWQIIGSSPYGTLQHFSNAELLSEMLYFYKSSVRIVDIIGFVCTHACVNVFQQR